MAGLNKKADVGIHERNFHGHVLAIRKDSCAIRATPLDETEYIIPSAGTQSALYHSDFEDRMTYRPQFKPLEWSLNSNRISSI